MSDTVKRTSEIEEFTNLHFIHPISSWLVPKLAAINITPNMVSLTGMFFGILAGFSYHHYQSPPMAVLGFIGMIMWHIMDGADGQLARLTKSYSEIGAILDGVCDYVTFISVYVGIGLMLSQQGNAGIWVIILSAGALHAIQSSAYELQRAEYDYWGHGKQSAALPEIKHMIADLKGKSAPAFIMSQFLIGYVRMQRRSSGISSEHRQQLKDILRDNPDKTSDIRALYREIFAPAVNKWSILCANYRTIAIFIACLAGQPIYFFWFEIAFLTPVLIVLVQKQRKLNRLFSLRLKEII
ncbi:MAG: CDP-diacylglycerol--serine O-phosphatidyltransferase [Alphaproteobacteria bacterium]|nr:MAG: CDP-diacylglycerol--serine O-phosphatidyltransferase [Alphaproteobacteria bacterium]